jgi:lysophospholipase L1-like esterase
MFNKGNTSYGMDGFVSALVGYAPNLDDTDRAAFKDAMEYAYGMNTASLTKRIVFIGDSISVGLDAQNAAGTANDYGWTRRIHKHLNSDTIALHYDAASGRRLVDYLSTYSSSIAHQIITDDPTTLAVILLGINDINNAARTDAQVYADMEALVAAVQADGGEAIVCSLLPASTLTSGEQAYRTAYVAALQADHAFADGFIDFDAEPTMGPDAAASNTTYYTDGVHPTSVGHEIMAEFAADVINTYLGI